MDNNEKENLLFNKLKLLNETLWESKTTKRKIEKWLENFKEEEKLSALFLLSEFIYFNKIQINTLLVSIFRDYFKYDQIQDIRKNNHNTLDQKIIETQFKNKLSQTRFVSLGNPSESSAHLLYDFRKVNKLAKSLFIHESEIKELKKDIKNFVFIDDIAGSGSQAINYSEKFSTKIKEKFPKCKISYYLLLATKTGKQNIKEKGKFDFVDSVLELDNSYKCFHNYSRIFGSTSSYNKKFIENFCAKYGKKLYSSIIKRGNPHLNQEALENSAEPHKLGFKDGQLLLGFNHNTPDNCLPIFWYDEDMIDWYPIFKRHNKVYN